MAEEGPRPYKGVQVMAWLPSVEAEQLDEIAQSVGERRSALLRSIIHATIARLQNMEHPPSTLGGIENAIIK